MSLLTFNFSGVDAIEDLDLIVSSIRVPVVPEISESTQDVPGMVGKIFLGNSYGQKKFEIDVIIKAEDAADRAAKIHQLTELVMTFGDDEYPMIFSNDPEYTYYGHFTDVSVPQKILQTSSWMLTTLTFTCSDPKGYAAYTSNDITVDPVSLLPDGNSECYPIFTCIPKNDVTKIAVADEDGNYVFIGADVDPGTGEALQNLEPLVLHDNCNDLGLWSVVTTPTFTIDNGGVIKGSFGTTTEAIRPIDYGANTAGKFHGPMIKRNLPSSYSDFKIRVRMVNNQYYARAIGKIEMYLLDTNGYRIGKFALKDNSTNKSVQAEVQLGNGTTVKSLYSSYGTIKAGKTQTARTIKVKNGTKTVKSKGKSTTVQLWKTIALSEDLDSSMFTNFYGYLELQKIGNKYRVEIMRLTLGSNPGWSKPIVVNWTDNANTFTANKLAGVALYSPMFDIYEDVANPRVSYSHNALELCDIAVWNIINGGNDPLKPRIIAHAGQEIKINCEDHRIYKNGGYFMDKLYIGSQFLKMQGGVPKTFAFEPSLNEADWYVEYRPTTS